MIGDTTTTVFQDDFRDGMDLGGVWELLAVPPAEFTADDGVAERVPGGVRIASSGVNRRTGDPAFSKARADSFGHLNWMASPRSAAASGIPGYDVPPNGTLAIEFRAGARTFGTADHPFGGHVSDPDTDLRLASAIVNFMDYGSGVIFDFWLTNRAIYPFCERLVLPGSGATYQGFASIFTPVPREPDQIHDLAIRYDARAGRVFYTVDGRDVATVDDIGRPPHDAHLLADHGGTPETATVQQLLPGVALMTYLDGALGDSAQGLVPLDIHYALPTSFLGGPMLFGQGAELTLESVRVTRS